MHHELELRIEPEVVRSGNRVEVSLIIKNCSVADIVNFCGELIGGSGLSVLGQDWFSGHLLRSGGSAVLKAVIRIGPGEHQLMLGKLTGSIDGRRTQFQDLRVAVVAQKSDRDQGLEQQPQEAANQAAVDAPAGFSLKHRSSLPVLRKAVVLTALGLETAAVLRHLSDIREEIVRDTILHVGRFENWQISVVEVGPGNPGTAAIAERAIGHVDPEVALFVGIAGGVKDANIGDVVVASKVYGYEGGKEDETGFRARPELNRSAYAIEQRARALCLHNQWRKRLYDPLNSNARLLVGAIAAGEKVIASQKGAIAKFLSQHYNDTLAVEMEGRGFLAAVHNNLSVKGGVIRGISDLLRGKSKADAAGSQERAADSASSVAFEILSAL